MPVLRPGITDPLFDIELVDGSTSWVLRIDGGIQNMQEVMVGGSNTYLTGGIGQFGTGEEGDAISEQSTWEGGRGNENFNKNPTAYYDSRMAWTPTPDVVTHVPKWRFYKGYRTDVDMHMSDSLSWKPLIGDQMYIDVPFTASASYSATQIAFWIRRIGDPGALTVVLASNDSGEPDSVLQSATVDTDDITDVLSELWVAAITSQSITGSTAYHIYFQADADDNEGSHWEIGVDEGSNGSLISADGSTWETMFWKANFRICGADVKGKWLFFKNDADYAILQRDDGQASKIYLVGERGVLTSTASSGATTVTDTNTGCYSGDWVAGMWSGSWFKIINGPGKGQRRQITTNGTQSITLSDGLDVAVATTSEYVIYASDRMVDISPSSGDQIDGPVKTVSVINGIIYMGFGTGSSDAVILKARFNSGGSPPAHEFDDDGTDKADILFTGYLPGTGPQIYRADNSVSAIYRASAITWATNTTLSFGNSVVVGDRTYGIRGMAQGGEPIYITKEDQIGYILNGEYTPLPVPLYSMPETTNGQAILVHGEFIYFNWTYSNERLYGDIVNASNLNLDDVDINRGAGLPSNRQGPTSAYAVHPVGPAFSIDAGPNGISSVYQSDNRTQFEVFRAWKSGLRIKNCYFFGNDDTRPRLAISVGGDAVYIEYPLHHRNPLKDEAIAYHHEAVLETSLFDFGNSEIRKAFKNVYLSSENLDGAGSVVYMDYQTDEFIGTDNWNIGTIPFAESPSDVFNINAGQKRKIRLRFRSYTANATIPNKIFAYNLSGFGKKPFKLQWNIPVRLSQVEEIIGGSDPIKFLKWVREASSETKSILMLSRHPRLHERVVVIEEGPSRTDFIDPIAQSVSGTINIGIREYGL